MWRRERADFGKNPPENNKMVSKTSIFLEAR
jgi:hypothetical protein